MSQKSKSGDVRTCGHIIFLHNFFCLFIQGGHHNLRLMDRSLRRHLRLDCRIDNTVSDLLCQDQLVPRSAAVVFENLLRMNKAGDAQSVFRLVILDGVASHQYGASLHHLIRPSF